MEPAPGYHDRLPHDAAHFIVEDELKILGGIFGQMAAGGIIGPNEADARQRRKAKQQRHSLMKENRDDALFSEHAVYAAQSRWEKQEIIPETKIQPDDLAPGGQSREGDVDVLDAVPPLFRRGPPAPVLTILADPACGQALWRDRPLVLRAQSRVA